jgi:hypothetical protein
VGFWGNCFFYHFNNNNIFFIYKAKKIMTENSTSNRNGTIFLIIFLILAIGGLLFYFLYWKKRPLSAGSSEPAPIVNPDVVPVGTAINVTGSNGQSQSVVIAITELVQRLLIGMPFSDDVNILNGSLTPIYKNDRPSKEVSFNQYVMLGTGKSTYNGIVTSGASGFNQPTMGTKSGEEITQGVKYKNLIWRCTNEMPVGGYNSGFGYIRFRCDHYYVPGSEKVFPLPIGLIADFSAQYNNWRFIDRAVTQVALNTLTANH